MVVSVPAARGWSPSKGTAPANHHYHRKYGPLPTTFLTPNREVSVTAAAAFVTPLTCYLDQWDAIALDESNGIPLVEFTHLSGMNLASAPDSDIRALAKSFNNVPDQCVVACGCGPCTAQRNLIQAWL